MRVSSLFRNEDGAAAVEFAIVALAFIMFTVGIVEVGRGFHLRNQIAYAVDRGLRVSYLNATATDDALKTAIKQNFYGSSASSLSTSVTTQVLDGRSYRLIVTTLPFKLLVPNLSSTTISLSVSRRIPS